MWSAPLRFCGDGGRCYHDPISLRVDSTREKVKGRKRPRDLKKEAGIITISPHTTSGAGSAREGGWMKELTEANHAWERECFIDTAM